MCGLELYRMVKRVDERIDKNILQWLGHIENGRIAKRVYVGSHLVGQPCKRWIDSVNDY